MIWLLVALLLPAAVSAQEIEPTEPEIELPEVVLLIEDLSVESVVAGLPEDPALMPPERAIPLPDPPAWEAVEVTGPGRDPLLADEASARDDLRQFSARVELGAGAPSDVYTAVSLQQTGPAPRFGLDFSHRLRDGLGGHPPGSGYHLREDGLAGLLILEPGRSTFQAEGSFLDQERGLQEQGPYVSRTVRLADASASLTVPAGASWEVGGRLETGYHTDLLSGPSSLQREEAVLRPELSVALVLEQLRVSLTSSYGYATRTEPLQRASSRLAVEAGLGEAVTLDLQGGWAWSTDTGHLFPFKAELNAALATATFELAGGYEFQELDWDTVLAELPLVDPRGLEDNGLWFGEAGVVLGLSRSMSLRGGARFSREAAMPDPGAVDPVTGLITLGQRSARRLTTTAGLRFNLSRSVTVGGAVEAELFEVPGLAPRYRLEADAEASGAEARFGGSAKMVLDLERAGAPDVAPVPALGARVYYRATDRVTVSLEGEDLLAPLLEGPRAVLYPFQEPGLSGLLKIEIDL